MSSSTVTIHESYIHTSVENKIDQHIPSNVTRNSVNTEFEIFYQNILDDISKLPEQKIDKIKTNLRSTCEKYYKVKPHYKYRQVIENLSKNKSIVILKQDKGRGIVILNRSKYIEKCMSILNTTQFSKIERDQTGFLERKIQRTLRKIKTKIPSNVYSKVYPTGSSPGKFYGTAKLHKLQANRHVDHLPIRPIISNIGTATYHLAKFLAQLLKPLGESEYTIKSTKDFVKKVKKEKIPPTFQMVSFDVVSLFTNVPLDETIEIILKRIYEKKEIVTDISKGEMKELLYLCTKRRTFHF